MQPDSMTARDFASLDEETPTQNGASSNSERTSGLAPASSVRLSRGTDGKLWMHADGGSVAVELVRCFPWSEPHRFLSFRDAAGEERAFVSDLTELEPASRAALEETLRSASFVLDVVEVFSVTEDFELRSFRVRTAQGPRSFQTPLDAWPRVLPGGELLFEDVHGDMYRVPRPSELDKRSQKQLWAFID